MFTRMTNSYYQTVIYQLRSKYKDKKHTVQANQLYQLENSTRPNALLPTIPVNRQFE